MDISLRKYFRLNPRLRASLRADVFNAFDRVNFQNPETTVTDSDFGQISGTRPPRQMQLTVRLEF